jgi:hypothetical protein
MSGNPVDDDLGTHLARQGRWTLLWTVLLFVLMQLVLLVVMERRRMELRDPEFVQRNQTLQRCLEEHPGRPLWLLLGSSRVACGIRIEGTLPPGPDGKAAPLLFNYGKVCAGPLTQLLYLHRLLERNIHPEQIFIEFFPPLWHQNTNLDEGRFFFENTADHLGLEDLFDVRRYVRRPDRLVRQWLKGHALPVHRYRTLALRSLAPEWDSTIRGRESLWYLHNAFGWVNHMVAGDNDPYHEPLDRAHDFLGGYLKEYTFCPYSDRIVRDLVALCRREKIGLTVLFMPEHTALQSWYPPRALAETNRYLERLRQEHGLPVIDARTWVDDDGFIDGYHLNHRGARVFTERFLREVIQPLRSGAPPSGLSRSHKS